MLASKATMPEGVDVWVTPLVRDAEGDLPEVVLSRIAETVMMKFWLTLMWLGWRLWPLLR